MVLLHQLVSLLHAVPDAYATVTYAQFAAFLDVATRYAPVIASHSPRRQKPGSPPLPNALRTPMARASGINVDSVDALWSALGPLVLDSRTEDLVHRACDVDDSLVDSAGDQVGAEYIMPPVRECISVGCPDRGKALGSHRSSFAGHLYTLHRGVVPACVTSFYCKVCKTSYHPNYFVVNAKSPLAMRQYYGGMPEAIEATESSYFEPAVIQLFRSQMAFAHTSATIVARIYNQSLTRRTHDRRLTGEVVSQAFYIHALLRDKERRSELLQIPHSGVQAKRLDDALAARNMRMAGTGQPEWAHACDLCEIVLEPKVPGGPRSRLSACVMDGVSVGHTRCNVDRCLNQLASPRDRFCPEHSTRIHECAIKDCSLPVRPGARTCSDPAHSQYESQRREKGQAYYRLKKRIQTSASAAGVHHASTSSGDVDVIDDADVARAFTELDEECEGKSAAAPKLRSTLTRRWTHNEQLLFRCCGVMISRATFFDAESPSNSYRFLVATFPELFPLAKPSFIWFDNNCKLLKHMQMIKDKRFLRVGFPVDVFHAVNKHKDSDAFCQMNCNPAGYKELYDTGRSQWTFNSSAAEQGNVWFGQFQPVVREMTEVHFNFHLDEMMSIHNEWTVAKLAAEGRNPRRVPLAELQLSH